MAIGIIGGTGVYDPNLMENAEKKKVHTPYGPTSDLVTVGKLAGKDVVVIPRHGTGHVINPTHVPYRANLWAMKELGVTHLITVSAVGSLKEEYKPGELAFPDQFIDRTTKRDQTFYEGKQVAHIGMAEPFCGRLREKIIKKSEELELPYHEKGTCVVIEGPRFSSRAESNLFRSWGAELIGMTLVPEVVLAREMGFCFCNVSMVTDYDCWKVGEEVSNEEIIKTMKGNAEKVKKLLMAIIPDIDETDRPCECEGAIDAAMF